MHLSFLMRLLPILCAPAKFAAHPHRQKEDLRNPSILTRRAIVRQAPAELVVKMKDVVTKSIRQARLSDARELAEMCALLWPEGSFEEHLREVEEKITCGRSGTLPVGLFVAEDPNRSLAGFIEIGLRSHADGCDVTQPVGYIEGWYVREPLRGASIGRKLTQAAEEWCQEQGCTEIASDALIDNLLSQLAHSTLGFEVVDRCVHYRKSLRSFAEGER